MDTRTCRWAVALGLVIVGCASGPEGGTVPVASADAPVPRQTDSLDAPPAVAPATLALADGLEHLAQGRFAEAAEAADPAVASAPDDPRPVLVRGMALLLAEKLAEGRRDTERAYRLSGRGSLAARVHSFALRMHGDQVGAMRIAVPGHNDFDRLLLQVGNAYGALAFAGPQAPAEYVPQAEQAMAGARAKFPLVAELFVQEVGAGGQTADVHYARGASRLAARDFAGAERDLATALEARPDDPSLLARHATALVELGRLEQARRELSVALSWKPALVEGYAWRAVAAARMGDAARARSDLAIARELGRRGASDVLKAIEPAVGAALETPSGSPPDLFEDLLGAARKAASVDDLTGRALAVVRASNAGRRLGDETYQDRRRVLEWAVRAAPEDPDGLGALGRFLVDELDVRFERIEPWSDPNYFRTQTEGLAGKERGYAQDLFDRALAVDPDHPAALVGTAALKMRDGQWADAEAILKRVMALGPGSPDVLGMMSRILRVAAGQKMAQAAALRQTRTWTEYGYDVVYHYTRYPSAAELATADAYDQQAQRFLKEAREYLERAVEVCKGTAEAFDFQGQIAWQKEDYEGARRAWEQAVRLAPDRREYRYSLANAYGRLNLVEEWLEETTRARCLEHTTASAFLQRAWSKIANHAWQTVEGLLVRAAKGDAGDPRIAAFRAAAAEGQGRTDEALACYRAALAMELALDEFRRNVTPEAAASGRPVESPREVGRIIALRARIGRLLRPSDPAAAAELFLANVALEPRFPDRALGETIRTAVLPDASRDFDDPPRPRLLVALLRENRALAALALAEAGRHKEALEHFALIDSYKQRRSHAGGQAYLDAGDTTSLDPKTWLTAAESSLALGDAAPALGWLGRAAQYYESTPGGRSDAAYGRFQALLESVRGTVLGEYRKLRDQAVDEIRKAAPAEQNAVSEQWTARLRSMWQQWMRDEGVPPPWEDFYNVTAEPFQRQQQEALERHQQRAREVDARRRKDLEFRQWVNSEYDRIRRLPPDQQREEMAKLQEAIRRHDLEQRQR